VFHDEASDRALRRRRFLAEAVDHGRALGFGLLAFEKVLADVPVEGKEFAVDGESAHELGIADALLEVF
jgi:hypothetical protein